MNRLSFVLRALGTTLIELLVPALAVLTGFAVFALLLTALDRSPVEFASLVWKAGFGSAFALENTLLRAAPLILLALCVALPARLGLVVIGGEGAMVVGGLAVAIVAPYLTAFPGLAGIVSLCVVGALAGGLWIGAIGVLKSRRGVNETIASLLMTYIAIAVLNHLVTGPLRDPASLNKPSTVPVDPAFTLPGMTPLDVHAGLWIGVVACVFFWWLIARTSLGFGARIVGANREAAQWQGLPVSSLIIGFSFAGGACAGLAGAIEIMAVHRSANASLASGLGYSAILVAFLARHDPRAVILVAVLMGGLEASSGLIQRRMDLPDATILVLQGVIFVVLLSSEAFRGRPIVHQLPESLCRIVPGLQIKRAAGANI
ncbi:MAG: ABC transporter permease [Granulosicoccus sp.]